MQLWAAAILFIICFGAVVIFKLLYDKNKKVRFIVMTLIAALLALALLVYSGLTVILIVGIQIN